MVGNSLGKLKFEEGEWRKKRRKKEEKEETWFELKRIDLHN